MTDAEHDVRVPYVGMPSGPVMPSALQGVGGQVDDVAVEDRYETLTWNLVMSSHVRDLAGMSRIRQTLDRVGGNATWGLVSTLFVNCVHNAHPGGVTAAADVAWLEQFGARCLSKHDWVRWPDEPGFVSTFVLEVLSDRPAGMARNSGRMSSTSFAQFRAMLVEVLVDDYLRRPDETFEAALLRFMRLSLRTKHQQLELGSITLPYPPADPDTWEPPAVAPAGLVTEAHVERTVARRGVLDHVGGGVHTLGVVFDDRDRPGDTEDGLRLDVRPAAGSAADEATTVEHERMAMLARRWLSTFAGVLTDDVPGIEAGATVVAESTSKRGLDVRWVVVDGTVTRLDETVTVSRDRLVPVPVVEAVSPNVTGDSADIAMMIATVAASLGLNARLAATGDVDRVGKVVRVGAVEQKLWAAAQGPVDHVLVPASHNFMPGQRDGYRLWVVFGVDDAPMTMLDAAAGMTVQSDYRPTTAKKMADIAAGMFAVALLVMLLSPLVWAVTSAVAAGVCIVVSLLLLVVAVGVFVASENRKIR